MDRALQEVEFMLEHIEKKWPVEGVSRLRGCGYFFANSYSRHRQPGKLQRLRIVSLFLSLRRRAW